MIFGKSIYQILLGFISAIFLFGSLLKYFSKERNQSFFKFFASIAIWGSLFSFALFPEVAYIISEKIGLGENLNTLIFIGFVIVFIAIFKLLSIVERLERNISEIVRKEALSRLERENKKRK